MNINLLPHFQASMNATTTCLILVSLYFIKTGNRTNHIRFMVAALCTSTLFLISYLTYHYFAGGLKFGGQGTIRYIYFTILITHTILAIVVPPLVLFTVWKGLKNKLDTHKKLAKWAVPIWLYVSVTGVTVYWLLYHLYPPIS